MDYKQIMSVKRVEGIDKETLQQDLEVFQSLQQQVDELIKFYPKRVVLSGLCQMTAMLIHMANDHTVALTLAMDAITETLEQYCKDLGRNNWKKEVKLDNEIKPNHVF